MKFYTEDSDFATRPIGVIVECIILFFAILVLILLATPYHKSSPSKWLRERMSCKSNIKAFTNAVEKYNKDSSAKMHAFDQNLLMQGNYLNLSSEDKYYTASCSYKTFGDLLEGGIIFCESHGDVNGINLDGIKTLQDYNLVKIDFFQLEENREKERADRKFKKNILLAILIIQLFTYPIFHLIINMKFKKTNMIVIGIVVVLFFAFFFTILGYYALAT